MTTRTKPASGAVRGAALDHGEAMRLAAEEYTRVADAFAALDDHEAARPTPCTEWDVRQMCAHVAGMAAMAAGLREQRRQQRLAGAAAERSGRPLLDELTALQVREREGRTMAQLVAELRDLAPKAVRFRRRTPGLVRRLRLPQPQDVGDAQEWWSLGFLLDVILTRDPWMHRMDLAMATGRAPRLTADHDGVLVADVVAEWAERHGRPFRLTLTGPAGGSFGSGSGGEVLELDAVDFCRAVSGRHEATGLLATQVPF
jgi:uncharacterized protein (TIGR03083 family)